ncbi:heme ABC transporter permease/ATP-binding protein CydD [Vibrio agarivorans]|uniref:heme ABC transporter permease/ATP-binding protein CydD n=1 Tax=Vibrio agarivorans TaxID=153622 RepID=UPI002231BB80|nr:cysteine/glutathione ABC transporter permease/ATP-binding protein CydD [Vibrio agarivorans]
MDTTKQRNLNKWLKQQSKLANRWLLTAIGLGVLSSFILLAQAALIATILHSLIIEHVDKSQLIPHFIGIVVTTLLRAGCSWAREVAGFRCGEQIRVVIRQQILDKLESLGPAYIKGKPAGAWATLLLEQVDDMQDFFARYLPQMSLSVFVPLIILVVVFPVNWAAGLIFVITAPLVPIFMALVGRKAADANRKNFKALQRLSGHFYDRLQAMSTIRLFNRTAHEADVMRGASEVFRKRTMDVLRIAFLSSAVLEFFTSISIAITAVYFGFSFIGELNFGHYGAGVTLFAGLFILILAPEFYQPLRDLGTFYHAKQQAVGAAESIVEFLDTDVEAMPQGTSELPSGPVTIEAEDVSVFSPEGKALVSHVSFVLLAQQRTAIVGPSGAGKTSLVNAILGFLPYQGSLKINGIELRDLHLNQWRDNISWVGQNPMLLHGSIMQNLTLGNEHTTQERVEQAIKQAHADEFIDKLGLDHPISDRSSGLSVGQAQRLAVARAIIQNGQFWLLDEPTASLDARSEKLLWQGLESATSDATTLMITHQLSELTSVEQIFVMENGQITQQGSFEELAQQTGLFKHLLDANQALTQANKENLDA